LCAEGLGRNLGWLQNDLKKEIKRVAFGFSFLMDSETLSLVSFELIKGDLLSFTDPLPLSKAKLEAVLEKARARMKGLVPRYVDLLETILAKREKVLALLQPGSAWQAELDALIHLKFLNGLSLHRLAQYPRYLDALALRIQRARQNPVKDAEKAQPLIRFIRRYAALKAPLSRKRELRWLLEEFKVQVFAQELGTDGKVSAKIIEAVFAELENQAGRNA
jgi:ATP-dependent helicase HrpA